MEIKDVIGFRICWKAIDIQLEKSWYANFNFRSIVSSHWFSELYLA